MTKLNLGSGLDKRDGYLNLDKSEILYTLGYTDGIFDLTELPWHYNQTWDGVTKEEKCYMFRDESIEEILLYDVLEHLEKPFDILQQCYRVLKWGTGILKIRVPNSTFGTFAHIDPTHKSYFTWWSFNFLDPCSWFWKKYGFYYFPDMSFHIKKKKYRFWNLYFELEKV